MWCVLRNITFMQRHSDMEDVNHYTTCSGIHGYASAWLWIREQSGRKSCNPVGKLGNGWKERRSLNIYNVWIDSFTFLYMNIKQWYIHEPIEFTLVMTDYFLFTFFKRKFWDKGGCPPAGQQTIPDMARQDVPHGSQSDYRGKGVQGALLLYQASAGRHEHGLVQSDLDHIVQSWDFVPGYRI